MIQSRPYLPNPAMSCERCVFGRGDHADHCDSPGARLARNIAAFRKDEKAQFSKQDLSRYFRQYVKRLAD